MSALNFRFRDHSDEYSTVRIETIDVTAANYDPVFGNLATQGRNELEAAFLGVSLCNLAGTTGVAFQDEVNDNRPASAFAQREKALRVYGRIIGGDNEGQLRSISIPGPDLQALAQGGSDIVPLDANAAMETLVSVLEARWRPSGATGITIERAVFVGRAN